MDWLQEPDAYSENSPASKMEVFEKIVNGSQSFTIFAQTSTLDFWLSSEFASGNMWVTVRESCIQNIHGKKWVDNEYYSWVFYTVLMPLIIRIYQ